MTRPVRKRKAKRSQPELSAALHLIIVTHIILSKAFHIMYVKTHHMTKTVRHKESRCPCCNCLINITFHEAQILHSFCNYLPRTEMQVAV